MANREMLYDIIYALAARDGREQVLFGDCAPNAHEAFAHSLPGGGFPELWFELPLAGEPWFDLHALASREHLNPDAPFAPETCGGNPGAFAWFAAREEGVRQLALSWDVSAGDGGSPAVQLLVSTDDAQVTCDFLEAAGRGDAAPSYRAFRKRLPEGWFACYAGVFPRRTVPHLRVECIPAGPLQRAYAEDPALLEAHLRQTGLADLGDTMLLRCQVLAKTPFSLEFQFDVDESGRAGSTFGASVRFSSPSEGGKRQPFDPDGKAGELMRQVEDWGLADGRWRLLSDASFATWATLGDESSLLYCYPAFLKLRWRDGDPVDAKAYLIAGLD